MRLASMAEQLRWDFFSADESDNDFEEEPEEALLTPVPSDNEQQILATIPEALQW